MGTILCDSVSVRSFVRSSTKVTVATTQRRMVRSGWFDHHSTCLDETKKFIDIRSPVERKDTTGSLRLPNVKTRPKIPVECKDTTGSLRLPNVKTRVKISVERKDTARFSAPVERKDTDTCRT